jgi:hypothetical protein
VKLARLSGAQVNALCAKLAASGRNDGERGLAAQTIHHAHEARRTIVVLFPGRLRAFGALV